MLMYPDDPCACLPTCIPEKHNSSLNVQVVKKKKLMSLKEAVKLIVALQYTDFWFNIKVPCDNLIQ